MTDLAYSLLFLLGIFVMQLCDDRRLRRRLRQLLTGRSGR